MPKIPTKQESELKPFWRTKNDSVVYYQGDVLDVARRLPSESVHMIVTSPPYWGLRDYGTGQWEGGNQNCDHEDGSKFKDNSIREARNLIRNDNLGVFAHPSGWEGSRRSVSGAANPTCKKCGAKRIDSQLGSEPSPDCGTQGKANCKACFVCNMVAVFKELYRVLRDEGTCWLNLGDSYGSPPGRNDTNRQSIDGFTGSSGKYGSSHITTSQTRLPTNVNLPPGNLLMMPHRVALALQANGWIVRQDIVWAKPAPMPESIQNRCTKAHEYIFLLAKQEGYYYDAEAIKEKSGARGGGKVGGNKYTDKEQTSVQFQNGRADGLGFVETGLANRRSVWTISSGEGYDGAHFATFPKKLVEPCILAGTSEAGCCSACGTPYHRVVEKEKLTRERSNDYVKRKGEEGTGNSCANTVAGVQTKTVGWDAGCACGAGVVPCVVCDPFIGSGTSAEVCIDLGRHCVGIDLSAEYLEKNAVPRVQGALLSRSAMSHLAFVTVVERAKAKRFDGGQVLED